MDGKTQQLKRCYQAIQISIQISIARCCFAIDDYFKSTKILFVDSEASHGCKSHVHKYHQDPGK